MLLLLILINSVQRSLIHITLNQHFCLCFPNISDDESVRDYYDGDWNNPSGYKNGKNETASNQVFGEVIKAATRHVSFGYIVSHTKEW